jgi:tripartite-type tricarboxylate transporter receptor subunit TctC
VKGGQLRLIGVMAAERSKFMPDAPTFREQGFDTVMSVSRGVAAPAKLPPAIEARLTEALEKVLSSKEHRERAEGLSLQPEIIKGEAYRKFLKDNEQATKQLMGW